jgi:hypothetical protein
MAHQPLDELLSELLSGKYPGEALIVEEKIS